MNIIHTFVIHAISYVMTIIHLTALESLLAVIILTALGLYCLRLLFRINTYWLIYILIVFCFIAASGQHSIYVYTCPVMGVCVYAQSLVVKQRTHTHQNRAKV